jgi:hypothetical protein
MKKITQDEKENLNCRISTKSVEFITKTFPKSPRPECFTGEYYQSLMEERTPICNKLSR